MSMFNNGSFGFSPGQTINYQSREQELSVRSFFNAVYAWMCVGLATTAVTAYGVAYFAPQLMTSGLGIIAMLGYFVLAMAIGSAINRISAPTATALFVLMAALLGVTLSSLFLRYSGLTLGTVFLETAGLFGVMSVYGYVTKRDLTAIGSFLVMALLGLILASIVNIFLRSPAMYWVISYAGILIFVGLTAFDTQRLKMVAIQTQSDHRLASRLAVVGSLMLYLDFVNLFLYMLQVMGGNGRRD